MKKTASKEGTWTDRESVLLVECFVHMQEVTGHDVRDCTRRLNELLRAYEASNDG